MFITQEELKRFKSFMGFDTEKSKPKRKRGRPKGSKNKVKKIVNKKSKWL
tara:strand:- start:303 stop:452 length:150 start_codon:yes stop_codon:yes gene_type:complete